MAVNTTDVIIECCGSVAGPVHSWRENLYINSTTVVYGNYSWDFPCQNWTRSFRFPYAVVSVNCFIINVTATADSLTTMFVQTVMREACPSSQPTYSTIQAICGGAIMKGLDAVDNVNVSFYEVYVNGTCWGSAVSKTSLQSETLVRDVDELCH